MLSQKTHTHTLRTARQEQSKKSGGKKTPQEQQRCPRRLSVGEDDRDGSMFSAGQSK